MWVCPDCQTVYPAPPDHCVCAVQRKLRRTNARHLALAAKWEEEKRAYIAQHGLDAYNRKMDREIAELFS